VHGRRKKFFQGGTSEFFQTFFFGGPKVLKLGLYHSKLRKQHFLLKFSNSCPSSDTHACVQEKVRATPLKSGVISNVSTPFLVVKFF